MRTLIRSALMTGALALAALAGGRAAGAQSQNAPAFYYGDVKLFGDAAKTGVVVAMIGGTECGSGALKSGAYSLVVLSNCGPADANGQITFKLVFARAGKGPEDAYLARMNAPESFVGAGEPRKLDLQFPDIADEPLTWTEGCAPVVSKFANKTAVETFASFISPAKNLESMWRWDTKKNAWSGYVPGPAGDALFKTMKDINRGDTVYLCVADVNTAGTTLQQPKSPADPPAAIIQTQPRLITR